MKIGVISDTHNFLDPEAVELLQGVQHILHGGDVGQLKIVQALEQIAPVTAVLGNTDDPAFGYPLFASAEIAGWRFFLHHIVNPASLTVEFERRVRAVSPQAVIFGHTHKAYSGVQSGVLYFNPGYAGKPRFGLQRSIGLIHVEKGALRTEILPLNG